MNTWNQRMGGVAGTNNGYMKPGNPAGNGTPGTSSRPMPSGQSFAPNIQTGVSAGPVMAPAAVQATQNKLRSPQMTAPPQDAGQNYAPYMQHLNSLLQQGGDAAAIDFGRDAAFANAQQDLASQQARSNAGLGWGGVGLQQYGNQLGQQQQGLAMLLSLLGQFGV